MYFSDYAPPHFHALYSGHEAVVAIETGEVIRGESREGVAARARMGLDAHR